jgi:hypothetical protein
VVLPIFPDLEFGVKPQRRKLFNISHESLLIVDIPPVLPKRMNCFWIGEYEDATIAL